MSRGDREESFKHALVSVVERAEVFVDQLHHAHDLRARLQRHRQHVVRAEAGPLVLLLVEPVVGVAVCPGHGGQLAR